MREARTYDVLAVSRALSPITHNAGTEGNETLIQREPVIVGGRTAWVPVLTGNAIRHRMVRAPGSRHLVDAWGLAGKLNVPQLQFLFNGGALTQSTATESLSRIRDFWRIFPLGRILGGCLPDMLIGGALYAWRGTLACRENEPRVRAMLPEGYDLPSGLMPAQRFLGRYQYVRQNATKSAGDLAEEGADGDSAQMIYSGQSVMAGSVFVHGFRLTDAKLVDLGALLHSVSRFSAETSTIGGMSSRGHGRMETHISVNGLDAADCDAAVSAYLEHLESVREEGIEWFARELGAGRTKSAKKKGKTARKKAKSATGEGLF